MRLALALRQEALLLQVLNPFLDKVNSKPFTVRCSAAAVNHEVPQPFAVVQETSASWPCPSLRGLNDETVGFSASFSH
jgi:hypothetical protein